MIKKVVVALALLLFFAGRSQAACIDHKIFEGILKTNVDKDGLLDYDNVRISKGGDLYQYISFLEAADLKQCSDAEQMAFWINAYNAHIIEKVLARPQMKSIADDFKIFGEKFKIARINLSLNEIEHRVLRSNEKRGGPVQGVSVPHLDPRIHFALVSGAMGSPRLLRHAFTGPALDTQLQMAAAAFVNDPAFLRVEGGTLTVSSLLRWYAEDFASAGGPGAYLTSLLDPARPETAELKAKIVTDFPDKTIFKYDWTLNRSVKNKNPGTPPAK